MGGLSRDSSRSALVAEERALAVLFLTDVDVLRNRNMGGGEQSASISSYRCKLITMHLLPVYDAINGL
jgi:hypothetical protein